MAVLYLSENGKGWSLLSFHLLVRWILLYLMVESPLSGISNSLLDIVRRVFKFFCNSIVVLLSTAYCNLINWSTEVLQHVLLYLQSVFININKILSSEFIVSPNHLSELWMTTTTKLLLFSEIHWCGIIVHLDIIKW